MMARPLDRDILVTSVMPHMHWLGKDFTFTAVLPDGKTRIPLIKIDHWNFNWQGTYAFKEPIRIPKGSWFEVEAHFDNSDANPANQNKPPKVVRWGEGTNDEMCIGIFEWVVIEGEPEPEAQTARRSPIRCPADGQQKGKGRQRGRNERRQRGNDWCRESLVSVCYFPCADMMNGHRVTSSPRQPNRRAIRQLTMTTQERRRGSDSNLRAMLRGCRAVPRRRASRGSLHAAGTLGKRDDLATIGDGQPPHPQRRDLHLGAEPAHPGDSPQASASGSPVKARAISMYRWMMAGSPRSSTAQMLASMTKGRSRCRSHHGHGRWSRPGRWRTRAPRRAWRSPERSRRRERRGPCPRGPRGRTRRDKPLASDRAARVSPSRQTPSVNGLAALLTNGSINCVSASMPV